MPSKTVNYYLFISFAKLYAFKHTNLPIIICKSSPDSVTAMENLLFKLWYFVCEQGWCMIDIIFQSQLIIQKKVASNYGPITSSDVFDTFFGPWLMDDKILFFGWLLMIENISNMSQPCVLCAISNCKNRSTTDFVK